MSRFKPRIFKEAIGDIETDPGREQEERIARKLGGKAQPGSGSSKYAKGDVRDDQSGRMFLIEAKQTKNKSLRIKGDWLVKITKEAMAKELEPALEFEIHGVSDPVLDNDWIAVPMRVFKKMVIVDE